MKFLLWALIIAAVILFVLHARRGGTGPGPGRRQGPSKGETETMVCCAQCGVYVPRSEAVTGGADRLYCSDEHRRLDGGV